MTAPKPEKLDIAMNSRILRLFDFAVLAKSVPSATSTKHCLVPKVASDRGANFGTIQCLVLVAKGTDFVKTAKSKNPLFLVMSHISGFGAFFGQI